MKLSNILSIFCLVFSSNLSWATTIEEYVKAEQWSRAKRLLAREQRACPNQKDPESCQLKFLFSSAWLQTRQAEATNHVERKNALLQSAKDDYLAVLESRPGHTATQENLVLLLEQLGDLEQLKKQLASVKDKQRAADVAEIIADLSFDSADYVGAFDYYWRAQEQSKNPRLINRCIDAFAQDPQADQAKQMRAWSAKQLTANRNLQDRINVAIIGHMNKLPDSIWEPALLDWVMTKSRSRAMNTDLLKENFKVRSNPIIRALYDRLQSDFLGASEEVQLGEYIIERGYGDGWWVENEERANALANAGWSSGHNHLRVEKPEAANNTWLGALFFAPWPQPEMMISLDLLTDLARIQQLHKAKLDPDGARFRRIENLLFDSKLQAYQSQNSVAINRHHTVLGKMYADLGIFENGVRGAKFQLDHAIRSARELSAQNNITAPQPALAKLLADGYNCALPAQDQGTCRKDTFQARRWYGAATVGYLELDAVDKADNSLKSVKRMDIKLSDREAELEAIIRTRSDLTGPSLGESASWLNQSETTLPKAFVERQQFKVFADTAIKQGDASSASKAISISKKQDLLKDTLDLNRVKKLTKTNQSTVQE